MPQHWRLKSLLVLGLVIVSAYFLVPTLRDFDTIRETALRDQLELPFYLRLFPKEEIKLGLDLQGGIYAELEVEIDDALKNRADLLSTELSRFLASEPFSPDGIERLPDSTAIRMKLKAETDVRSLRDWLRKQYGEALVETQQGTPDQMTFDLTDRFRERVKDESVRQSLEAVRHRIDRYGVAEPSIVRLGTNRIAVELPGMTDPERALNLIKKAGRLEFKLVDESVSDAQVLQWVAEAREATRLENFTEETVTHINQHLSEKIPPEDQIFFEVHYDPVTRKIVGGTPYLLKRKAEVTGEMLKAAQVNFENNEPYVSLSLDTIGTRLFADLTKANIGKRLAIVLDGNVAKAPVIRTAIPSGEAQITLGYGDYTSLYREAEDLSLVLREGALPARLKELTKTIVGPSLGRDSIERGVRVTLVAGLLVILFMGLYYRLSGLLADLALGINVLFILAALAIFQATLTLPGIAGIVLTIGMAVDANVLIFERIREEIRAGKSARNALVAGYSNAMSAILDSNITTFLSGVVLYQFGTGPIRGFAVTLMIGIATTLFTAIVVTRVLQEGVLYGLKRERVSV